MAKSKPTPLKDEPMNSSDEICSKIETLIETINRQNNYLKIIAQNDGFDSEFSFFKHQFDATSAIYEAMVKYLKEHKAKIIVDGKEEAELLKAEELLKKYRILLAEAMELIQNYIAAVSPITTVVIHEPLPTHTVLKPQPPQTAKGMFAYLFLQLPWYHIQCFFTSTYFKHWLIIIMVSVWFVSVFLACFMAIDNARMHQMYHTIFIHSGI
jgi:hypothetical protein